MCLLHLIWTSVQFWTTILLNLSVFSIYILFLPYCSCRSAPPPMGRSCWSHSIAYIKNPHITVAAIMNSTVFCLFATPPWKFIQFFPKLAQTIFWLSWTELAKQIFDVHYRSREIPLEIWPCPCLLTYARNLSILISYRLTNYHTV